MRNKVHIGHDMREGSADDYRLAVVLINLWIESIELTSRPILTNDGCGVAARWAYRSKEARLVPMSNPVAVRPCPSMPLLR